MTARVHRTRLNSFDIKRVLQVDGGGLRQIVSVTCAKCHRVDDIPWTTAPVPEFIKNKMVALGWLFDPYKKSACVCPICHKRHPASPELAIEPPATITSPEALMTTRLYRDRNHLLTPKNPKEERMAQTPPTRERLPHLQAIEKIEKLVADTPALPRPLTPDERMKVRHLLDSNFDDAAGYYISGYSDQRIGQELNVPWAAVAQIREAAYGPLREDERLTKLRAEFVALKADYNKFDASIRAEINKCTAMLRDWQLKINAIETKLKELQHD